MGRGLQVAPPWALRPWLGVFLGGAEEAAAGGWRWGEREAEGRKGRKVK